MDVLIEDAPVALFEIVSISNNSIAPATVVFNNESTNADIYEWDFGDDSALSNEEHPGHTYTSAGNFTVTLKVSKAGSIFQDIYQDEILIQAIANPFSTFNIGNSTNSGCAPTTVNFINGSSNATSYEWNFGDPASGAANISTLENPSHTYNCLLYTSPSPRDATLSRMPSSA